MKLTSNSLFRVFAAACAFVAGTTIDSVEAARPHERHTGVAARFAISPGAGTLPQSKEQQPKEKEVKVSDNERKAAMKIESAPDISAKLQAAGEFVKKYPKSSLRPQLAGYLTNQILTVPDAAQKVTHAESLQRMLTEPGEAEIITPLLIDAYVAANRTEDAFRISGPWLEKNPDDIGVQAVLAIIGVNEAKRNNPKFVEQSQRYGLKALELLEADKKPATVDDATWTKQKALWMPQLYHSLGFIAMVSGNAADAMPKLEKAIALDQSDPINYLMIGNIKNDEYQQLAKQYRGTPIGPAQTELLPKINAKLDEVIDAYAHAVALSAGKPQYQQLHDQVLQDLQGYYKFRNNNSTDGLQKLIDKYKSPSKPAN